VDCVLAPANLHELEGAEELLQGVSGFALTDCNYWKPEFSAHLKTHGLLLLTPFKFAAHEKQPCPRFLAHIRYRIETAFGQLVERFHAKRVWASDLWHLTSRWMRKLLSHTLAAFFCAQQAYLIFGLLILSLLKPAHRVTNNLIILYGLKKIIFPVCDRNFFGQEKSCLTWEIETRGNQQHRPVSPSS